MPPGSTHPSSAPRILSASCMNRSVTRPPHIAVFMADDLGFADTGFAGSPLMLTPQLDRLASEAVHFTRFRTPTWCAPSRAAFLTGRHGWELGIATAQGWTVLGGEVLLLSEVLRELGYRTAIVGKFHFNPATRRHHPSGGPFGCGFDHQHGFLGGETDYYEHDRSWSRDGKSVRERGYATELFAAEAERLLRAHALRPAPMAPFFLWLALNAPHTPLQARRPAPALRRPATPGARCRPLLTRPRRRGPRPGATQARGALRGVARPAGPARAPRRSRPALGLISPRSAPQVRTYAAMVLAMDQAYERTVGALRQARAARPWGTRVLSAARPAPPTCQ